jgi:hypothetical protein
VAAPDRHRLRSSVSGLQQVVRLQRHSSLDTRDLKIPEALMKRQILTALSTIALAMTVASAANATTITGSYTFDGATTPTNQTGPWTMTSTDGTYSILRFVFDTPVLFSDLTSFAIDYNAVQGGIGGGSPRVAFVTSGGDFFYVHLGPAGSFADPTLGPGNTGNLLALADLGRYDLGGLGGSAYTDRADALSLAGSLSIVRASIVIDSFGGNDRNFVINGISAQSADFNDTAAVPEPASMVLLGTSLAGLLVVRRKRTIGG